MLSEKQIKELPHHELIEENKTIILRSVFDFKGGNEELFPFLLGCEQKNCTVVFKNEDITVCPKERMGDGGQNMLLSFYMLLGQNTKIATDYLRYLGLCAADGCVVKIENP